MNEVEAQTRRILDVISQAAASGKDLPEIKKLADIMGIPYRQFNDRLYKLLVDNILSCERVGVYTCNGVDVYFGSRYKRRPKRMKVKKRHNIMRLKPREDYKYVRFERTCLCCGETFRSQKIIAGETCRTLYRLCKCCRSERASRDPLRDFGDRVVAARKSTLPPLPSLSMTASYQAQDGV